MRTMENLSIQSNTLTTLLCLLWATEDASEQLAPIINTARQEGEDARAWSWRIAPLLTSGQESDLARAVRLEPEAAAVARLLACRCLEGDLDDLALAEDDLMELDRQVRTIESCREELGPFLSDLAHHRRELDRVLALGPEGRAKERARILEDNARRDSERAEEEARRATREALLARLQSSKSLLGLVPHGLDNKTREAVANLVTYDPDLVAATIEHLMDFGDGALTRYLEVGWDCLFRVGAESFTRRGAAESYEPMPEGVLLIVKAPHRDVPLLMVQSDPLGIFVDLYLDGDELKGRNVLMEGADITPVDLQSYFMKTATL
jgi:hypothetical protein